MKRSMLSSKLSSSGFNSRFSFSSKEDQSHKLEYFKDKLGNITPKVKKESKKGLKDDKIEDLFKTIKFENFDSTEIKSIIKDNTQSENKTKQNKKIKADSKAHSKINKENDKEIDENDKSDEILNYDFLNENNSLIGTDSQENSLFLKDLEEIIKDIKCKGCGIELQCTKKEKLGYVPDKKVKAYLGEEVEDDTKSKQSKIKLEDLKLENIEIPKDSDYLKKLSKKNLKKSDLICERCFKLQNYMRLNDTSDKSNKEIEKSKSYEDKVKLDNYSLLIKKIDTQKLIQQIMIRLSSKSHVFYLCDITDFEPSVNIQIIREIKNKNCGLTFIVNKFDILPNDVNEERVRIWVGEKLKEMISNIEGLKYNYILVSSKNGHNFDYVIHNIKNIKQKAKDNKVARPKIFMIGNANSGKSSFINKLIQTSNKFLTEERRKKKLYKKNYIITDPTLVNLDKESQEKAENEDSDNSELENIEETKLTTSPLPGTTIGITKINSMTMGVKVFDTPGIPNLTSISYLMNNYINMISTFIIKKVKPYSVNVKQGYSIWLGALARIDMLNGQDKFFTFFLSHDITIHKTFLLNAERIFENQAGNLLRPLISDKIEDLNLVSHHFDLKCDKFNVLNYDLCISGLGWFSISGKGFVQIDVSVPKGVKVYLRNKPLMPFEIKEGGVKKYFGNTINANSKLNKKMREAKINKDK